METTFPDESGPSWHDVTAFLPSPKPSTLLDWPFLDAPQPIPQQYGFSAIPVRTAIPLVHLARRDSTVKIVVISVSSVYPCRHGTPLPYQQASNASLP